MNICSCKQEKNKKKERNKTKMGYTDQSSNDHNNNNNKSSSSQFLKRLVNKQTRAGDSFFVVVNFITDKYVHTHTRPKRVTQTVHFSKKNNE